METNISRLSDFSHKDTLYVGTVRSPVSKGKLVSITMPFISREYSSITAADILGTKTLNAHGESVPILAESNLSYKGEPLALIVGPDRAKVHEAASRAEVRVTEERPEYSFESTRSEYVKTTKRAEQGDVETALKKASKVIFGDYRMGPQDHYYPEPQGAAASFEDNKLVVFSSTQWPFHVRRAVSDCINKKQEHIVVRPTILGTHLDGKLWYPSLLACHVALAAALRSKPAMLILSRLEDFLYTTKRAPVLASYRAGLDSAGKLTALDIRIMINGGAYVPFAEELAERSLVTALGAYACPAFRINARVVTSALPPMGAFAGIGTGPIEFAAERLAEDCAASCDMDPSEWRAFNMLERGTERFGIMKKAPPYSEVSDKLLAISDYARKRSSFELIRKRRSQPDAASGFGIGMAFGPQLAAPQFSETMSAAPAVELVLSKDSVLTIRTSVRPCSEATSAAWKHMASSLLALPDDAVIVEALDTEYVPDSGPAAMSRCIAVITNLITSACEGLASKRFREALPLRIRKTEKSKTAKKDSPLSDAAWGGAVVEVELDPIDEKPIVRGIWMAVKAGTLVAPEAAQRILEHDVAQALGLCTGEYLDITQGPADKAAASRYTLPRIKDAPPIVIACLEDDSAPRGIGELAYNLVPAAFANALSQARAKTHNSIPLAAVYDKTFDMRNDESESASHDAAKDSAP